MREKCSQKCNTSSAEDQIEALNYRRKHPVLALQEQRSFERVFSKPSSKNVTDEVNQTVKNEKNNAEAGDGAEQLEQLDESNSNLIQNQSAADHTAINESQQQNQRPGVDGRSSTKSLTSVVESDACNGSSRSVYVPSRSGSSSSRSSSRISSSRSQRSKSPSHHSKSLPLERLNVSKSTSGKREVNHSSSKRKSQSAFTKPAEKKSRQENQHKESGQRSASNNLNSATKANGMPKPSSLSHEYSRRSRSRARRSNSRSRQSNSLSSERFSISNSTSGKREVSHSSSKRESQSAFNKPPVNQSRQANLHKESGQRSASSNLSSADGMTKRSSLPHDCIRGLNIFFFTFSVSSNTVSVELWQIGN